MKLNWQFWSVPLTWIHDLFPLHILKRFKHSSSIKANFFFVFTDIKYCIFNKITPYVKCIKSLEFYRCYVQFNNFDCNLTIFATRVNEDFSFVFTFLTCLNVLCIYISYFWLKIFFSLSPKCFNITEIHMKMCLMSTFIKSPPTFHLFC